MTKILGKLLTVLFCASSLFIVMSTISYAEEFRVKAHPSEIDLLESPRRNYLATVLPSDHLINELGQLNASVAISTPAGPNGTNPGLSLSYADGTYHNIGSGWSLTGISTITKCAASKSQYGLKSALSEELDAPLCLDGRLLVKKSEINSRYDEFSTENDAFLRIRGYRSAAGYERFELSKSDGTRIEFGNTDESKRLTAAGVAISWHQSEFKDTFGNTISFDYEKFEEQEISIKSISYGSNQFVGNSDTVHIDFFYDRLEKPSVKYLFYEPIRTSRRLTEISIREASSAQRRSYRFEYTKSLSTGRDLLTAVRYCDDIAGVCTVPTTFQYQSLSDNSDAKIVFDKSLSGNVTKIDACAEYYSFDLVGDGVPDLVCVKRSGDYATELSYAAGSLSSDGFVLADFELARTFSPNKCKTLIPYPSIKNGISEFLCLPRNISTESTIDRLGGITEGLNVKEKYEIKIPRADDDEATSKIFLERCNWSLSDIDGDGYLDLFCAMERALVLQNDVWRYSGKLYYWLYNPERSFLSAAHVVQYSDEEDLECTYFEGDFNVDGTADFVCLSNNPDEKSLGVISDRSSFVPTKIDFPFATEPCDWVANDFDGDITSELVCDDRQGNIVRSRAYRKLNNSAQHLGSQTYGSAGEPCNIFLRLDLDNDSVADPLCASTKENKLTLLAELSSEGTPGSLVRFFETELAEGEGCASITFGTFTLTGANQIACTTLNASGAGRLILIDTGKREDVLTSIRQSDSHAWTFVRRPYHSCLTELPYSDEANGFRVTASVSVVCEVSEVNGPYTDQLTYKYSKLMLLENGRGLAPFSRIVMYDLRRGERSSSFYRQEHPLRGMRSRHLVEREVLGSFVPVSDRGTTYGFMRFDQAWATQNTKWDYDIVPIPESRLFWRERELLKVIPDPDDAIPVRVARSSVHDGGVTSSKCIFMPNGQISCNEEDQWLKPSGRFPEMSSPNRRAVSYFVFVEREVKENFSGSEGLPESTISEFEFDRFGCMRRSATRTGAFKATTTFETRSDFESWRLCQVMAQDLVSASASGELAKRVSFEYNSLGAVVAERSGTTDAGTRQNFEYDDFGNVIRSTSWITDSFGAELPDSKTVRESTHIQGRFVSEASQMGGWTTEMERDPFNGTVVSERSNGLERRRVFGPLDILHKRIDEFGRETEFYGGGCGDELCGPGAFSYNVTRNSTGFSKLEIRDFDGRIIRELRHGRGGSILVLIRTYDRKSGNLTSSVGPVKDAIPASRATWEYDDFDRMVSARDPRGVVRTFEYNGSMRSDFLNGELVRRVKYNEKGLPQAVLDERSGTTEYKYDPEGRVSELSSDGQTLFDTVSFGEHGPLGTETSYGESVSWNYDGAGRVVSETRGSGGQLDFRYDANGRLVRRVVDGEVATWRYRPGPFGTTKLFSRGTSDGFAETLFYDDFGRLIEKRQTIVGVTQTLKIEYDKLSRISSVSSKNGELGYTVEYGSFGEVTQIFETSGRSILSVKDGTQFDTAGTVEFGNRVVLELIMSSSSGEITQIKAANSNGSVIFQEDYEYNPLGLLSQVSQPDGSRIGIEYDRFMRIATYSQTDGNDHFIGGVEYDEYGRIVHNGEGSEISYDEGPIDRIVSIERRNGELIRAAYDHRGRQVSFGSTLIEYDELDRPVSVTNERGKEKFIHDTDGRVVGVFFEPSAISKLLYVSEQPREVRTFFGMLEVSSWDWVERSALMVPFEGGTPVVLVHDRIGNAAYGDVQEVKRERYLHFDRIGSLRAVTDEFGRTVGRYDYDLTGFKHLKSSSGDAAGVGFSRISGFTGQKQSHAGTVVDFGARQLNAKFGSFMSPDLVIRAEGDVGNIQVYGFAGGDPFNRADPTGLFLGDFFGGIGDFFGDVWNGVKDFAEGAWEFITGPTGRIIVAVVVAVVVTVATGGTGAGLAPAILSGMAAGAASAAVYTALGGGSMSEVLTAAAYGAVIGAVSGGLSYGVSSAAGSVGKAAVEAGWSARQASYAMSAVRILGRGVASGVTARAFGGGRGFWKGDFEEGFKTGIAFAAASEGAQQLYEEIAVTTSNADGESQRARAFLDPSSKPAQHKVQNWDGVAKDDYGRGCTSCNNFGQAQGASYGGGIMDEGNAISTIAAKTPGFNSWAYLHDSMMAGQTGWTGILGTIKMTSTILPAGVINWTALSYEIRTIQQNAEMSCGFGNREGSNC